MRTLADISPGQFYRHHKGDYYVVTGISCSAENPQETIVAYRKVGMGPGKTDWHHKPEDFLALLPDGRERFEQVTLQQLLIGIDPKELEGLYFDEQSGFHRREDFFPQDQGPKAERGAFRGELKIQRPAVNKSGGE